MSVVNYSGMHKHIYMYVYHYREVGCKGISRAKYSLAWFVLLRASPQDVKRVIKYCMAG